jgi:hypothetical protein
VVSKTPKIVPSDQGSDVSAFLSKLALTPVNKAPDQRGRLIFAMDATMSRQPTWDQACHLQADMFDAAEQVGGLDTQLIYFRGHRECRASKWHSDAAPLQKAMARIHCQGGYTQIERVLKRAIKETTLQPVNALVYVGDAVEEEVDAVCAAAGKMGVLGVPCFFFQEGSEPYAERAFREMARLTKGAWCRFDSNSAAQLRDLLQAVAVYAAGGRKALEDYGKRKGGSVLQLTQMLEGKGR